MVKTVTRTFIRMVSQIMRMEVLNRMSEMSKDKKLNPRLKPEDIEKRAPTSLLTSLSSIQIINGNGWKQMTVLTKYNR